MLQKQSPETIARELSTQISNAGEFFDNEQREPTVQVVSWIKGQTEKELNSALDDTYLLLQKKSSGDIVFPSGSIEKYEIYQGKANPQGIILATLREFEEELHEILGISANNIIDIYPFYTFETEAHKKYIQFRLLACLSPLKIQDIEQKFQQTLPTIGVDKQEHSACYIRSYEEIMKEVQSGRRNLKDSTRLSLEHHRLSKKIGRYG